MTNETDTSAAEPPPDAAPTTPPRAWDALTAREAAVGAYLARGYTNREIAKDLDVSVKTIDTHRGHVLKKLAAASGRLCRNNSDLTRLAIREGVISAED